MPLDPQALADRYAALWNEPDAAKRRAAIEAVWTPEGEHYVRTREVRGYAQLFERVTGSYEKNVRDGGYRFRAVRNAQRLREMLTFNWEMIRPQGEEVVAVGLELLRLDGGDRILVDYQFIVS